MCFLENSLASMFLNKASVGAGLLFVCVWGHAGANRQLHGVCRSSGDVHWSAQWIGEQHWCVWVCGGTIWCVAHLLFHHSSSPAAVLSQEILVKNPEWLTPAITLLSSSTGVVKKCEFVCVWMFAPSVPFPAAQSEIFVSFAHLTQVPVVLVSSSTDCTGFSH